MLALARREQMALPDFQRFGNASRDRGRTVHEGADFRRQNIGSNERWLSMLAGGALALYGLRQRSGMGRAAAAAGGALLYRGWTGHCPVVASLRMNRASNRGTAAVADYGSHTRQDLAGARGIHVDTSIRIGRPVHEVYRFWRDLENLPTFMRHLEQVSMREEGVSHWVARGPAGIPVEWDARIINDVEDKVIGWQSLDGSTISTAGSVNFRGEPGGTMVHVRFQYQPPGGALGAAVARLFGEEPNQTVRADLQRLKEMLEGAAS
jgi:uncharacterized membrane protein